jgi:hypothetical protein
MRRPCHGRLSKARPSQKEMTARQSGRFKDSSKFQPRQVADILALKASLKPLPGAKADTCNEHHRQLA